MHANAASTAAIDSAAAAPEWLLRARLPRWLLPAHWPAADGGAPALADLRLAQGRVQALAPHEPGAARPRGPLWDLAGALVLPGLVEAHTHLDKAFTLPRMGALQPGLAGAIAAMAAERERWSVADLRARATRALHWAWAAGVVRLRTHCDWWQPAPPLAWQVLRELAQEWAGRIALERVALVALPLCATRAEAAELARSVAASGPGALLGGFVHSADWNPQALRHLFEAAQRHDLDLDLHVDEELNPGAQGLAAAAALVQQLRFGGHVVCGHNCALAVQDEASALATLDAVAQARITLVTLPVSNLLLQDAACGRTPRRRGITLVHEARARGIPLLIGSDNVQDPFCPLGSFDPLEALAAAVLGAQLAAPGAPFDLWSQALCRADWLRRGAAALPLQPGSAADLIVFPQADHWGFPSRTQPRLLLRQGRAAAAQCGAAAPVCGSVQTRPTPSVSMA